MANPTPDPLLDLSSEAVSQSPSIDPRYLAKPGDSYTKLAMRNMVRRGKTSMAHFALTTMGLLALLVGLAYVFH